MAEIYSDKDYCTKELRIAREMFSDKEKLSDETKVAAMHKSLGFMYLYCPSDMQEYVLSQMTELERRAAFYGVIV